MLTAYIYVCNASFNVHMLLCTAYHILPHVLYAYVSVSGTAASQAHISMVNTIQCIHTHTFGITQYRVSVYQQLHVLAECIMYQHTGLLYMLLCTWHMHIYNYHNVSTLPVLFRVCR